MMGHWSDGEVLMMMLGCEGVGTLLPLCCTVGSGIVAHHEEQEQADRVGRESSCGATIFCMQLVAGPLAVS